MAGQSERRVMGVEEPAARASTGRKSLQCTPMCKNFCGVQQDLALGCLCLREKLQLWAMTGFISKCRYTGAVEAAGPAGALGRLRCTDRCLEL